MLTLSAAGIKNSSAWEDAGIENIKFDYEKMAALTRENPAWVHFGAGNIFRGYVAILQQTLLNKGKADTGIIAVETYDLEIIDKIYAPYNNLGLLVIMNTDDSLKKTVVGSIAESLAADLCREADWARLRAIFAKHSLQMASFTITEKGYNLRDIAGEYLPDVQKDMQAGPERPQSLMAKIASLSYLRYKSGQLPMALVSMDNCSRNGERLYGAVSEVAFEWVRRGLVETGFVDYLANPQKMSFPWTMIDKITPRPSERVKDALNETGLAGMDIIRTAKNTFIAPFVNAEKSEYLVIEDKFPNGRMPLEIAGVYFTDRKRVDRMEKMKVCTCLNPLHTALAVFGCLLGYTLIADEIKDIHLKKLIEKIGYKEGMPVVVNPGIMKPEDFIREVVEVRLPNRNIPDTPQRIATDTSQKVGARFGETIKAYRRREDLDPGSLTYIPLVIAAWCRYLLGVDDEGRQMDLSPDPLLDTLRSAVAGIKLGEAGEAGDNLKPVLANESIFGVNLYEVGLGEKIENYFMEMAAGTGAVRATLKKYL